MTRPLELLIRLDKLTEAVYVAAIYFNLPQLEARARILRNKVDRELLVRYRDTNIIDILEDENFMEIFDKAPKP